ncbi:MAG: metallophosphoesterase family protein [Coriobacteriia bacterium]|nr:metallophosphoesterase family protein [Coriobacteriia bacterium]
MRRIALFSDIHGNTAALDAVLGDMDACGITERYCLGDLVGYGPDPAGVVDRIRSLGVPTIMGNYDDGIGNRRGECGCYYATDQARSDGAASYAFTEPLIDDERAAWLAALPHEIRLDLKGTRVLLAHGSPRKINEYLLPDRTDEQLVRLAVAADADVVCVGHVHVPYHRVLSAEDGRRIDYVSSGSVGKPKDGDPRACWVELIIGDAGEIDATFHRVAYDIERVAAAMLAAGLPDIIGRRASARLNTNGWSA